MNERLTWLGQKQEKTLEAKSLESSIKGLRESIRTHLNPHNPIKDIDPEFVQQQAFEIADKVIRYNGLCHEIEALNQSLGLA